MSPVGCQSRNRFDPTATTPGRATTSDKTKTATPGRRRHQPSTHHENATIRATTEFIGPSPSFHHRRDEGARDALSSDRIETVFVDDDHRTGRRTVVPPQTVGRFAGPGKESVSVHGTHTSVVQRLGNLAVGCRRAHDRGRQDHDSTAGIEAAEVEIAIGGLGSRQHDDIDRTGQSRCESVEVAPRLGFAQPDRAQSFFAQSTFK